MSSEEAKVFVQIRHLDVEFADPCPGDRHLPVCKNCLRAQRYCDHSKVVKFRHHAPPRADAAEVVEPTEPQAILPDPEAARLFQHYVKRLAPWYDLSDSEVTFTRLVPLEALSRPLLLNAILAFSAIHLSRTTVPSLRPTAEKFHAQCVKLLIAMENDDVYGEDGITLAAVCLLRSYEILGGKFDPNRHLSGAFALAASGTLSMHEHCLSRAGFFNYLREDITFSLTNRCPLKIDLGSIAIPASGLDDEDKLNVATLFLANAINRIFGDKRSKSSEMQMQQEFSRWRTSLPAQFTPYFEESRDKGIVVIPIIRMVRDCHVADLQYILVGESVITSQESGGEDLNELHDNAVMICGLAFTAESPPVVVNSFGPISFSCRYLQGKALQMELIRRLHGSRKETGWPVQRIINDLEKVWASQEYEHG